MIMKYTTKTEYGLQCLLYMAKHGDIQPITIKEVASVEKYSQPYIEKIFQSLRAANIVVAQHGNQGGYALARSPEQISLKEVIEALEGQTFEVYCEPHTREHIVCTHYCACEVTGVWMKAKELLDGYFGNVTLSQLVNPVKAS